MTAAEPQFIVAGNALPETIIAPNRTAQRHTGGVAAVMATELMQQGETPLLIAPETKQRLPYENGIERRTFPLQTEGWARIDLSPGGRTKGRWPSIRWAHLRAAFAETLNAPHPNGWLLLECALESDALAKAACLARELGWKVIANATSPGRAARIREAAQCRANPAKLHAVTMNRREYQSLSSGVRTPAEMMQCLNAGMLLVTRDREGWELHARNEGIIATGKTQPPPAGAHVVGAGDAATAGLARALARQLPIEQTVNTAVTARLRRNAQQPG